jgi:hypothetical protein
LLALLLCNKAPKYPFVTTSINISKRDLGALKKRKKRKRKIKERGQMSQYREISSILSSPQSSSKIKRGV